MSAFSRILFVVGALLLLAHVSLGQTTVAVSPATKTVNMPNQFTLNVNVTTDSTIHGADISLRFDHNILTYNSVLVGSFIPGAYMPPPLVTVGAQYDVVRCNQVYMGAGGSTGSGTLLTFTFTAKAVGTTSVTLPVVDLRTANVLNTATPVVIVNGSVQVDPALPIQLYSFTALEISGSSAQLHWKTMSEIDNLGFEVQRSLVATGPFESIPGSFIEGHGTTVEPQEYSYTDAATEGKAWSYRLKQTDVSGPVHYSSPVQISVVTSVEEQNQPTVYALEQNYPNPFNPTTTINFQLPTAGNVRLVVLDVLGQEVATLVNGHREAGYYREPFNAAGLSSGIYFYQLKAGEQTFLKKMLLVK